MAEYRDALAIPPAPVETAALPVHEMVARGLEVLETVGPATRRALAAEMRARGDLGYARYGQRLQPGNGRCAWVDAWQEALDLAAYLRKWYAEDERPDRADLYRSARDLLVQLWQARPADTPVYPQESTDPGPDLTPAPPAPVEQARASDAAGGMRAAVAILATGVQWMPREVSDVLARWLLSAAGDAEQIGPDHCAWDMARVVSQMAQVSA